MSHRAYTSSGGPSSFDVDGVMFTAANLSMFDLADVAEMADIEVDSPTGIKVLRDFFAKAMGEDEFGRFRAHCAAHGTDANVVFEIFMQIVGDLAGPPAQSPSDSSDGRSSTGRTSRVISLSAGVLAEEPLTEDREAELAAAVATAEAGLAAA